MRAIVLSSMKKSATIYLTVSFVLLVLIGIAIGYAIGRDEPGSSVSSDPSGSSIARDLPAPTRETITKEGTLGCLKSAGSDGPQTMDCALGLTTADGTQYGLGSDDPSTIGSIATGTTIRVTGTLSADTSAKYDTAGTIHVKTVTIL